MENRTTALDTYLPTEQEFLRRVKDHKLVESFVVGQKRHLKFRGPFGSVDAFDILTWSGHLCYTGDMGTYVFARLEDMFDFFRGRRINPQYWGEKVIASGTEGVTRYDPRTAATAIKDWVADEPSDVKQDVYCEVLPAVEEGEEYLRRVCWNYEYDGHLLFQDFYEVNLHAYSYHFIFACRAIVWGIHKFEEQSGGTC